MKANTTFEDESNLGDSNENNPVHIRLLIFKNKPLTLVEGLPNFLNFKILLKHLKRLMDCNGAILEQQEIGKVLQFQGDRRKQIKQFLIEHRISNNIIVFGLNQDQ
ncbi:hypothetical protein ACTFIV_009327 [Dictyostelium citrinum]